MTTVTGNGTAMVAMMMMAMETSGAQAPSARRSVWKAPNWPDASRTSARPIVWRIGAMPARTTRGEPTAATSARAFRGYRTLAAKAVARPPSTRPCCGRSSQLRYVEVVAVLGERHPVAHGEIVLIELDEDAEHRDGA